MRPTILIVDDHKAFRESASALLTADGFTVVGAVEDAAGARSAARRLRPDIVLVDVQLPDVDGLVLAAELAGGADAPRVVVTSSLDAAAYGSRLPVVGVTGFIAKRALTGETLAALVAP